MIIYYGYQEPLTPAGVGGTGKTEAASGGFILIRRKWQEAQAFHSGLRSVLGSHRSWWLTSVSDSLAPDVQASKIPGQSYMSGTSSPCLADLHRKHALPLQDGAVNFFFCKGQGEIILSS